MAIIQISKLQQRAGNLVDLPQLVEAEMAWASDARRLFIGKTVSGLENVEVLTSYSAITFSQIDGAVGNLNISNTVADGQVLAYDGTNWVNKGGTVGGTVDLGAVGNVSIAGGSTGYVLETDGLGNLTWSSKGTETAFIQSISQANPGLVTTADNSSLVSGAAVTITNCPGMTEVNGGTYYANVQTSNTFTLYSDLALSTAVDTSGFTAYSNTSMTATSTATNIITVGDATLFALNIPARFVGDVSGTNLDNANTFYIKTASGTSVTVSDELLANGVAGSVFALQTVSGLSVSMYGTGGRLVSPLGGATSAASAGSSTNTQVLYNDTNLIQGDADFTYDSTGAGLLTLTGNANVGNLNSTGSVTSSRLFSNVATGTTPIVVTSTTRVANLNVSNSLVSGTVYTAAQPAITSVGTLVSLAVTGNITSGNVAGTGGVFTYVSGDGANLTALSGANVTGEVPFADTANAVAGANVSGAVSFATTANNVAGANVSGEVDFAQVANAVAGANVSGAVALATSATSANAVAGANVSGTVPSATLATFATTANAVAGGNVSGTVALATTAGSVTTAAQGNITSVGALTSLTVSGALNVLAGTLQADTLTTGASGTAGSITGNWTLTSGSRLTATYADLAEYYEGDSEYESGQVLDFGGEKEVHLSATECSQRVAGIVTTSPAYVMNDDCPGLKVAVALQGRVPTKVTGKCEKGDMMVSDGAGHATAWYNVVTSMQPGVVIGKAIQARTDTDLGIIEIAVGRL